MDEMLTKEAGTEEPFDVQKAVKELIEYVGHLANEITEIKTSIMDELINPINEEYTRMQHDEALSDWRCKYAEKLEPMNGKLKAIEGEDFDILEKSFDDFNERTDGMEADDYVDALAEKLNEELNTIAAAFGVKPEEVEEVKVETKGGEEVEAKVEDGEVVGVEKEVEKETTEETPETETETEVETPSPEAETEESEKEEESEEERPEGATDTPDDPEENYKYWQSKIEQVRA